MSLMVDLKKLKVYFYDQKDKRFIRAVEDVGFSVSEGAVLGIVGESGCGKTVTALSMMGLLDSEPGVIGGEFFFKPKSESRRAIVRTLLRGMNGVGEYRHGNLLNLYYGLERYINYRQNPFTIVKDSEKWLRRTDRIMEHVRGKNISMIFQNPLSSLNPFMPISTQLEKTITRFEEINNRIEVHETAIDLLRSVRLSNPQSVLGMYAGSLSLGMAQRVIIAIALASNPCLLIADEPTSGLDTTNKYEIITLLETLINQMRLTLILISHNIRIVEMIATEIAVMYAGIVVESGRKRDIIGHRHGVKHPYTEALLSSMPADSDIKKGKRPEVIQGTVPDNKLGIRGCPFMDRCPYAKGKIRRKCRSVSPRLVEVSRGHCIRCFLYY